MTWEPQHEGLQQIITILKESQSPDTATQRAVQMVSFRHAFFSRKIIGTKFFFCPRALFFCCIFDAVAFIDVLTAN